MKQMHLKIIQYLQITSFVLRLGVDRDELDPDLDGGLSLDGFELLPPGLSARSPFIPILSRSRSLDSTDA